MLEPAIGYNIIICAQFCHKAFLMLLYIKSIKIGFLFFLYLKITLCIKLFQCFQH